MGNTRKISIGYKLFLVLLEIGFGVQLQLVGTISISELFVFGYTLLFLWHDRLLKNKLFQRISLLYLSLLLVQIITEQLTGNLIQNSLRGIAVTVISYCHLYFLIRCFLKDQKLVYWLFLGIALKYLLFPSSFIEEGNVSDAIEGKDAAYLKFVIAPLIIYFALALNYVMKKYEIYVFMLLGVIFVIAGARSSGAISFLTGFIVLGINILKTSRKNARIYLFFIILLGYGLYTVYVDKVLSGSIKSGNSEQLLNVKDPYNPVNLLQMGRAESFVGFVAFMDKPWTGHGAWKSDADYGYKYHMLQSTINNTSFNDKAIQDDVIPSHSVLIGYAMQNGVFALILIAMIVLLFFKMGFAEMLNRSNPFQLVVCYLLLEGLWNAIFSPISHFRLTLPLCMAFLFTNHLRNLAIAKNEKE
jgi:hypothetical protein